jgi:hypothetical protein
MKPQRPGHSKYQCTVELHLMSLFWGFDQQKRWQAVKNRHERRLGKQYSAKKRTLWRDEHFEPNFNTA